jgi:hypothetical protein
VVRPLLGPLTANDGNRRDAKRRAANMTEKKTTLMTLAAFVGNIPEETRSLSTAQHWAATGQLPTTKVGRHRYVKREDAARFLGVSVDELVG